jgi:hypothetical protein
LHIVRLGVMPCDCFGEVVLDTGREGLVWALGWNVVNVYVVVGIGVMIGVRCRLLWKGWCWRCRRTSMIFCSPGFRTWSSLGTLRTTAPTTTSPSQLIDEHLPRHLVGRIQRQCTLQCLTCISW